MVWISHPSHAKPGDYQEYVNNYAGDYQKYLAGGSDYQKFLEHGKQGRTERVECENLWIAEHSWLRQWYLEACRSGQSISSNRKGWCVLMGIQFPDRMFMIFTGWWNITTWYELLLVWLVANGSYAQLRVLAKILDFWVNLWGMNSRTSNENLTWWFQVSWVTTPDEGFRQEKNVVVDGDWKHIYICILYCNIVLEISGYLWYLLFDGLSLLTLLVIWYGLRSREADVPWQHHPVVRCVSRCLQGSE